MAARLGQVEALAPLPHPLMLAGDIEADQHTPFALGADPHDKIVTVAAGADGVREQVIQVIVNDA